MAVVFKRLNFNMDEKLVEQLDEFAEEMHITRSAAFSLIVSEYFQSKQLMSDLNKMMKAADALNMGSVGK